MPNTLKSVLTLVILLYGANAEAAFTWPANKGQGEETVTLKGHMYFNVTHSGVQGEQYLLNQQLSNIKLIADWRFVPWGKLHGLMIYNSWPTPLYPRVYLDEAYLELKEPSLTKWYAVGGRQWIPFGVYKNDLIYKPATKALSQTNEYAALVGWDDHYYANVSLFPPRTKIKSSSLPLYYNLNMGIHETQEDHAYDLGLSYLYSIAESDLFQYNRGFGGFLFQQIESHVPGIAAYSNIKYKRFSTYLSYVSALTAFKKNELSYQGSSAIPTAMSLQSGYEFSVKTIPFKVIGFYDRTFQALALQLPEQRIGMGLNMYPHRYLDVQFQYSKDYSYGTGVTATGLNKQVNGSSTPSNTLALQLVLNF